MFQTKVVEKIKTHILCSITSPENGAVCEVMWKNIVQPDGPQMTIWRMRIACYRTKATNTHSEYVILLLFCVNNDYANVSECYVCYTYIACPVDKR